MVEAFPVDVTPDHALASPLTLLFEEERHGDRQAKEILLLTYTSDLGFFEAFGLGVAQACGARVTTVSDVRMSRPDPRAARRAGRTYLPGNAICRGAFHPKLVVIAGPRRVTVAIGSGNATLAGWQSNAELWTVLQGDETARPAALIPLADWLRQLPGLVRFSDKVPEALARVAGHIDGLAGTTDNISDPDVVLVSTSTGPIIDQLPHGPVDELAVCAPFHDPGAVALGALVKRLKPKQLKISYQPTFTNLDGPAIGLLADRVSTELRTGDESQYRHGKLVEWTVDGTRYALTGSPNLSGAALLHSIQDGGNCELGVIAPISATLLPPGGVVSTSEAKTKHFSVQDRHGGGPLVLGATRVELGLHVLFSADLPRGGHLELSLAAAPPETWERAGDVAAGDREVTVTIAADGGSRVRLVSTALDGKTTYSNTVFVVDPTHIMRLPGITSGHVPATRPDELFWDSKLAEKFLGDAFALKSGQAPSATRAMVTDQRAEHAVSTRLDTDADGWQEYLDECAGRIGPSLLRFALGLPSLANSDATDPDVLPVSWADEMVADNEAGLQSDTTEVVAEEQGTDRPEAPSVLPDLRSAPPVIRRQYRRWAEKLAAAAIRFGTPERMLITRLLLWTAAAGAWDYEDRTWIKLLSQVLRTLGAANPPTQVEPQVGSLAAVALSVLRAEIPRSARTGEALAFDQAAQAVGHLLVASDPAYVEEYTQLLGPAFGAAVHPEIIDAVAAEVVQDDPIADAIWSLTDMKRNAHRDGDRLIHIVGAGSKPLFVALEAVGEAEDVDLVGGWATSTGGGWAMCIWQRPNLYTIDHTGPRPLWRHFTLSSFSSPRVLASQRSLDSARPIRHGPFVNSFPDVLAALEQLGLTSPAPPSKCTT